MSSKYCQFCGREMDENATVCPNCGKPVGKTKFCKHCGQPIDKDAVICPKCGKQVEQVRMEQNPVQQPQIVINNANSNVNKNVNQVGGGYPCKSKTTALLLCLFLGVFGVHRFYVGKTGTGLIWLFTLGLGGVGVLFDLVMIIMGGFRDKAGMPLV